MKSKTLAALSLSFAAAASHAGAVGPDSPPDVAATSGAMFVWAPSLSSEPPAVELPPADLGPTGPTGPTGATNASDPTAPSDLPPTQQVPEPSSLALMFAATVALVAASRRNRRHQPDRLDRLDRRG